ncbi:kinase-like protein [Coprinellus micaceus]|uniref:Kinase-like protein n=1 Tax=Coprinellus micaceus TaxID=71717 RepID=A0A4Y7SYM3_COPMI|nr:kinase-like protein [Coprinellus micaceus]
MSFNDSYRRYAPYSSPQRPVDSSRVSSSTIAADRSGSSWMAAPASPWPYTQALDRSSQASWSRSSSSARVNNSHASNWSTSPSIHAQHYSSKGLVPVARECPDLTGSLRLLNPHSVAGGGSSYVFVATLSRQGRNDKKVAVKVIRDQGRTDDPRLIERLERRIARESKLWHSFNHANVIRLYGLARDHALSSTVPGLVFPWCVNGTVLEFVQRCPHVARIPLIKGVASGLKYIHDLNAVHGDIKSANVLISDDFRPLITDFGCSKILKMKGFTTDLKASLKYMAPELMDVFGVDDVDANGKKKSGTPSTKETDVWAFGLVGAEIIGSQEVFPRIRDIHLPAYITGGGRPRKSDFSKLSGEADMVWPVLEMCWNSAPGARPAMETVLRSLA